jgi:hypothetical protein
MRSDVVADLAQVTVDSSEPGIHACLHTLEAPIDLPEARLQALTELVETLLHGRHPLHALRLTPAYTDFSPWGVV